MPRRLFETTWMLALLSVCLLPSELLGQLTQEVASTDSTPQLEFIDEVVQQHIQDGKLVGAVTWVSQRGKVVHHEAHGMQNREQAVPMQPDTIFRIYSFTKSITSAAALMLWEEGKFQLDDPVSKYVPAFADQLVYDPAGNHAPQRPMLIVDLLLHTSGVISPNKNGNEVEKLWHEADLRDMDDSLAEFSERVAALPLEFSPGERWKYGMSIDVLGHLIEV